MLTKHFGTCVCTAAILALAGAGCESTSKPKPSGDVRVAFDALSSAVAACGDELATCNQAAEGDASALEVCRSTFMGCQQTAATPAAGALADAVVACTATAQSCASSAAGEEASACHEELVTCLGATRPTPPANDAADGGGGGDDHAAPVASCIDELVACVTGDGDAMACGMAVRACIIAHVPAPPGVIPEDPGSAAADAGKPGDLPVPPTPDAGQPDDLPEPPTPDAGMAGTPPASTCMEAFQACVAAGGTQQSCGMALRECER